MPKANLSGKSKATMAGGRRVKKGQAFKKKKTSIDQALPLINDVNIETEEIVSTRNTITHAELNVSKRATRSTAATKLKTARQPNSNANIRSRGQLKQVRRNGSKRT